MAEKLTTKKLLLGVIIIVGILTLAGIIDLTIIGFQDVGVMHSWRLESILGSLILGGMGALTYFIRKFIDTRSDKERDSYKTQKRKDKLKYKLEKYTIKMDKKK